MFFPEAGVRVWLYTQPADMRKSYDGLSALVKNKLQEDPLSGQLFVFINRKGTQTKILYNLDQMDLGAIFKVTEPAPPPETEKITYERRKKNRSDNCVTDQGLRFDDNVPVTVIPIDAPELQGENASQYEVIDHKVSYRLAQRPGSYEVLEYRRPVVRHKASQTLSTTPAPSGLFDRSIADVSLIAGMLIDKFVYHLPLHRQHQRMSMSGVTLSRSTLTQLVQRGIELLRPIYDALLTSVLQSPVLAIDETPIKAGRKEKGKMQKAYFWPVYGLQDEVVFTFSTSKSRKHLKPLLEDWQGTLLTDGHPVYDSYCKSRPEITLAQCWTHGRRYFVRAQEAEPAAVATALDIIGQIYCVEASIREKELTSEQKRYQSP